MQLVSASLYKPEPHCMAEVFQAHAVVAFLHHGAGA